MASQHAKVEVHSLAELALGRVDLATALCTCADPLCACEVTSDRIAFREADERLSVWLYGRAERGAA